MATISQTISRSETDVSRQAYQILHFAFTVAPILFGLDKFPVSSRGSLHPK
jgi:hypothetical protein